ncbi:MAG: glycosyltransferase [Candidatus Micrarchaeota archaeon]
MMEIVRSVKHYAKGARYLGYDALFNLRKGAGVAKINPPKVRVEKPEKIKKVLFCLNRHEYGREEWGDSYEYANIYPAIKDIVKCDVFDFRKYKRKNGKGEMHKYLEKVAKEGEYDLMIFSLMVDDFDRNVIRKISEESPAITMNWFADDQWRFASFTNYWAGAFNFCTTTDKEAVGKYQELGYGNVIHTQWGVYEPRFGVKGEFGKDVDIGFVGQKYGGRGKIVELLRGRGLDVKAFGSGWEGGRVEHQQMVDVFANAKIMISPADSSILFAPRQMKSRFFEVAACGGFQLAGHVEELGDYFEEGKEIVMYKDLEDLAKKAEYYIENEGERKRIADAGKKRCLKEHTYQKRFKEIFREIEEKVGKSR